MSHLSQEFIEEMKQKLLEEKARLQADFSGLAVHTDVGDEQDENATEVGIDDVNRDLRARMESDLEKIEVALAKVEAGTYGHDSDGNPISEARLRAMPWAEKSI